MAAAPKLYLEVRKPALAMALSADLRLDGSLMQLEANLQGKVYQTRYFSHQSTNMPLLLRIPLEGISLPLQTPFGIVFRLFAHPLSPVSVLLGVQEITLPIHMPPGVLQVPISAKTSWNRVYNAELELKISTDPLSPVYEKLKPAGQASCPTITVFNSVLRQQARQYSDKDGPKSPARLIQGIALAILAKVQQRSVLDQPLRLTLEDEFSDLLSDSFIFVNAMEPSGKSLALSEEKRHAFVDFKKGRALIIRANLSHNIPNMYFSAVCALPNGNYLMAGGLSKDSVVNHQGIYYLNPLLGTYIKIGEIPFNLNSHEMHYYDGLIYIFGGVDGKEDKTGNNGQLGKKAGRIYTFSPATRQWSEGTSQLSKSTEKCSSILYNDLFVLNKGKDSLDIYSFASKRWTQATCKSNLLHHPSFFFEMNGDLFICHRKAKEDDSTYSFGKIVLKSPEEDTFMYFFLGSCTLHSPLDIQVRHEVVEGKKEYSIYIVCLPPSTPKKTLVKKLSVGPSFQWSNLSKSTLSGDFSVVIEAELTDIPYKLNEFCSSSLPRENLKPAQLGFARLIPELLPEADSRLKEIHKGIGHCFIPYKTGQVLLLNYFKPGSKEGLFQVVLSPMTLRRVASSAPLAVLQVPSAQLDTVAHSALKIGHTVFIVGGLVLSSAGKEFTREEINSLKVVPGEITPSKKIQMYRTSTHVWKTVEFLPEALYRSCLVHVDNTLYIIGGLGADNQSVNKIYSFDLKTFTCKHKASLEFTIPPNTEAFLFGDLIYIGSRESNELIVYSLKQNTTYKENSSLFSFIQVHSSIQQAEGDILLGYSLRDKPSAYLTKTVSQTEVMDLIRGKDDLLKVLFSTPTSTVEPEGEGDPVLVYQTEEDLFGLDQIDHSRTYSDFTKQNRFSILEETGDFSTTPAEFIYSEDRIMKLQAQTQKSSSNPSFSKGLGNIRFPRDSAVCSLPTCTIFISGGERVEDGKLISSNRCWSYDPTLKIFNELRKMLHPRVQHAIVRSQNYIYCFGGRVSSSSNPIKSCERYCVSSGTWEELPSLPIPLARHTVSVIFNKAYIIGGESEDNKASASIFIFDIRTQTFEKPESYKDVLKLTEPLKGHVSINTCFNTILVAGGQTLTESNMKIYLFEFNEGYKNPKVRMVAYALYSHVGAQIFNIDGTTVIAGGNEIYGTEQFCSRGEVLRDMPSLRRSIRTQRFILCEIKNEMYVSDSFLHNNPRFSNLYIFGLDHKKDIWR